MEGRLGELKNIFESEIKRRLAERARSPAGELRILLNGFKFYDYNNSGKVNQIEFIKGILRTGLSGFNDSDLRSLFSCYDPNNSGFVDYKNFCNYLYGKESLIPFSNSQNETNISENINSNSPLMEKQKTSINQNNNINNEINQNNQEQQNLNQIQQIPPEKTQVQENMDPSQTKDYLKNLIISLKDQIHTNNGLTYYNFLLELKKNSDENQNVSKENFVSLFKNLGLNISQNDAINLFNLLDISGTGKLTFDDIINLIVDPMNEHRKLSVINKFSKIDIEKQGQVKVSLLKEKYNAKGHPDVLIGKISEEEIYKQFCETLDIYCNIRNINDYINFNQFADYYNGISSSILDENYFQEILNGVWDENINTNNNINNLENIPQQSQMNNINENILQSPNNNSYNNNQQNRRFGRKKVNYNDSNFCTEDIGINSLFLGESKNVLPKSFGLKSLKRYRQNFNPQNLNNNYNTNNMNQNNNINSPYKTNNNQYQTNNINNQLQNNNYNKTPISYSQSNQINQSNIKERKSNNNNYENMNNFNNFMNNDRKNRLNFNFNPITNEYTPIKSMNKNQNNQNYNINSNNSIINNTDFNSTNNTLNTQNNDNQMKEIIINSLNKFKSALISKGCHTLFSFQRKLSFYGINHKGLISFDNLLSAAHTYSINLSQDELNLVFDLFDKEKTGYINYNELIQTIIGPISSNRQLIVQKLYNNFKKDNNGKVSINDIKSLFNPKRHPEVMNGKKNEEEIFGEFLDNIESYREYLENLRGTYDNSLNLEDFINFYNEVGVATEDDKMFEDLVNNCWNFNNSMINNNLQRNISGVSSINDIGFGGDKYKNNSRYRYRNNANNDSVGNLLRAGSEIISNKGF